MKKLDFTTHPWRISYKTSSLGSKGRPVSILDEFYIPVLQRSIRYDRMAGYFRSSSLAAASQGFTAFVGNQGKARLIAGADLNPNDVGAILQASAVSDPALLEKALLENLEGFESWPEDVQRGVRLLACMINQGTLEIRVAFRIDARTGNPIAFDSRVDGYVHEKWAIFRDESNRRIYINGSLNESRTALVLNAENIDVHCDWKGESEKERADEADRSFEILWDNQNPYLHVIPLPEAVMDRLLDIGNQLAPPREVDGTRHTPKEVSPPSPEEWLRFNLLKDAPLLPGGRYVGMETAPVEPWPHQRIVAKRLIRTWPFSYLMCDEVGLGKTIEAGLVIRSLFLAGLSNRVLIAAPASLTKQWQNEMASKFLLPFSLSKGGTPTPHTRIFPTDDTTTSNNLFSPNLNIVSTGLLARERWQRDLRAGADFDIALVDEAHYARRKNSNNGMRGEPRFGNLYRVISDILRAKSRSLLLATATPMQLDPIEVYDLLRLINRVGPFQYDPGLCHWYFDILGRLVGREAISSEEWEFLRKAVLDITHHDPIYNDFLKKAVIDGRIRLSVRHWLERGRAFRNRELPGIQKLLFCASPLSRVMLRHTRPLLEIYRDKKMLSANLAKRNILKVPRIVFTPQEKECYDQLETYCQLLTHEIVKSGCENVMTATGFYLSFLRLRFASSLYAIRQTVKRRKDRVELTLSHHVQTQSNESVLDLEDYVESGDDDSEIIENILQGRKPQDLEWERDHLARMLVTLDDLTLTSSKMSYLLEFLNTRRVQNSNRIQQTVIFTRFYDTLTDIVSRLKRADPQLLVGTYSGKGGQYTDPRQWKLVNTDREIIKQMFLKEKIDILVCTDAAAEGLNLQTADTLINFDLPWNPMKVEQRIGRIDRIGQKHDNIFVLNLCYADSAEEIVYGRLMTRLADAAGVVGSQQASLLPISQEEFQLLAEGKISEEELEGIVQERLHLIQARIASRELSPREIYQIYESLSRQGRDDSPVTMETIWKILSESKYLRRLGTTISSDIRKRLISVQGVAGIPEGQTLTTSRNTYEYGLDDGSSLHFATYGDPVFEALIGHIQEFEQPGCIHRLEATAYGNHGTLVGYAVACLDSTGLTTIRLVTSFHDLAGMAIDESYVIDPKELKTLQGQLQSLANEEFRTISEASQREAANIRAANSQLALDYLLVHSYSDTLLSFSQGDANFWTHVQCMEKSLEGKDNLFIPNLDPQMGKRLYGLLFEVQHLNMDKSRIHAPAPLMGLAIDEVCRLANKTHVKKSDLDTYSMMTRMERRVREVLG
ncbi:helicase-related protein [Desulfoplanes sp.]